MILYNSPPINCILNMVPDKTIHWKLSVCIHPSVTPEVVNYFSPVELLGKHSLHQYQETIQNWSEFGFFSLTCLIATFLIFVCSVSSLKNNLGEISALSINAKLERKDIIKRHIMDFSIEFLLHFAKLNFNFNYNFNLSWD